MKMMAPLFDIGSSLCAKKEGVEFQKDRLDLFYEDVRLWTGSVRIRYKYWRRETAAGVRWTAGGVVSDVTFHHIDT